uniref:Uncharacterized protein n=1 Tax=Eutreptiella gymnastica TaxID=73025 RepID=A0A6U8L5T1_9EUGL|mmetsp:Transcript_75103/g.132734  ORF Transcript_75103/g.132734 Transcript_75103/m.132734 type:complete len:292 (+) Transcript_75103:11-886(+)
MAVVLVAGATGGIGSGLLDRALIDKQIAGHSISGLVIIDLFTDESTLQRFQQQTAARCSQWLSQQSLLVLAWNAADVESTKRVTQKVQEHFGRLDALMIASGIGFHGVALDTPLEEMARITPTLMNINVLGPMLLMRGCLPMMLSKHPERKVQPQVVVMSSISGYLGLPNRSLYCASKFALNGFLETLALELKDAKADVRIIVVCPVTVQTNFRANWRKQFNASDADKPPPSSGVTVECCVNHVYRSLNAAPASGLRRLFIPSSSQAGFALVRLPVIGSWVESFIAARAKL